MSEQTKTSIISAVTSLLMLLSGIPAFAAFLPTELVQGIITKLPGFLTAISTIILCVTFVYKAWPRSKSSIVKAAAELPEVKRVIVDAPLADKVANVRPEVMSPIVAQRNPLQS